MITRYGNYMTNSIIFNLHTLSTWVFIPILIVYLINTFIDIKLSSQQTNLIKQIVDHNPCTNRDV